MPTLRELFERGRAAGVAARVDAEWADEVDVDSPAWAEVAVVYSDAERPVFWTVDRAGDESGALDDEVAEFRESLRDAADTAQCRAVLAHLRATRCLFTSRLPLDAGSEALTLTNAAAELVAERCDGVLHADGEGFYLAGELAVPLE